MQQLQEEANNYCSQKTTEQLYYSEQIRILPSKRTAVGSIFHFFLTLPRQKNYFLISSSYHWYNMDRNEVGGDIPRYFGVPPFFYLQLLCALIIRCQMQ